MKSPTSSSVKIDNTKLASASEISFNPFRCDVCDGDADADDDEDFYCRSSDCNQCASEYYEARNDNLGFSGDLHYRKLSKKRRSCSLSNLVDDDLPDIFQDSSTNTSGLYYSNSSRYTRPEDRRFNIENSYYETLRETEYLHEYKNELRDLQAIGYCEWVNSHLDRIKSEDLVKLNKFYSSQAAAAAAAAAEANSESQDSQRKYVAPVFKVVSKRKDQLIRVYLFVSDLSADLSDGIRLLHLIEVLYNCKLQKEYGKMKLHKLRNMATCLEYLVDNRKLKCFGINLADLVNGNLDIMLGLLFHIRRDYESAKFAIERQYKLNNVKNFFQNYETNKQMAMLERDKREKERVKHRLYFKSPLTLSLIKNKMPKSRLNDNSSIIDDNQASLAPPQSSSSRSSICSHCPHRKKFNLPAIKVENLSDDETQQQQALEVSEHIDQENNVYESIENLLENSIQRLNHLKEANEIILQKLEQSNKNLENSNSNELDDSRLGDSQLDETLNDIEDEPSFNSDIMGNDSLENGSYERDFQSSLSSSNGHHSSAENIAIQECNVEESNLEVEEIEIKASKTSTDLKAMAADVQRPSNDSFEQAQSNDENYEPRDSVDEIQSSSYSSNQESNLSRSPSLTSTTTSSSEPAAPAAPLKTEILIDYGTDKTSPPKIIILEQLNYTETTQGELNFAKTKTLRKNKPGIKTIDERVEDLAVEPSEELLDGNETVDAEVRTSAEAEQNTATTTTNTTSEEAYFNTVISAGKSRNKKKRRRNNNGNAKRPMNTSSDTCDQDYCDDDNVNDSLLDADRETSIDISSEIVQEEASSTDSSVDQSNDQSNEQGCEGHRETMSSVDDNSQFDVPDTPNVSRATETDESLSLTRPKVIPLDWPQKVESDTDRTPVVEVVETTQTAAVEPVETASQEPVGVSLESKEQEKEPEKAGSSQSQRRNRKKRPSNYYDKMKEIVIPKPDVQLENSIESFVETSSERPSTSQSQVSSLMTSSLINEPSSSSSSNHYATSTPRESAETQSAATQERCHSPNAVPVDSVTADDNDETEIKVGTTKIVIVEKSAPAESLQKPLIVNGQGDQPLVTMETKHPEPAVEQLQPVDQEQHQAPTSNSNETQRLEQPIQPEVNRVEADGVRPAVTLNDFIVKPNRKPNKNRGGKNKKQQQQQNTQQTVPAKNDDALRSKDRSPQLPPDSLSSSNSMLSLASHDPGSYQRSQEDVNVEETKDSNNNTTASCELLDAKPLDEHRHIQMENKETMTSESMIIGLNAGDARLTESVNFESLDVDSKSQLNGQEDQGCLNGAETTAAQLVLQAATNLDSFSTTDSSSLASYSSMTSASSSSMSEGQMFKATNRKPAYKIVQSLASSSEPVSSSVSSSSSSLSSSDSAHQVKYAEKFHHSNGSTVQHKNELRPKNAVQNGDKQPNQVETRENTATTTTTKKKPFSQQSNGNKENMREYVNHNGHHHHHHHHLNGGGEKLNQQLIVGNVAATSDSVPAEVGNRNEAVESVKKRHKEPVKGPDFQIPIIRVQDEEMTTIVHSAPEAVRAKAKAPATVSAKPTSSKPNGGSPSVVKQTASHKEPSAQLRKASKTKSTEKASTSSSSSSWIKKTLLIFLVTMFLLFSALVTLFYLTINEGNFNIGDLLTMTRRYLNN